MFLLVFNDDIGFQSVVCRVICLISLVSCSKVLLEH